MLHVTLVGIVTRGRAKPAPDVLGLHEPVNRDSWYGASELRVTGNPRR